ncbi:MAG: hypothetical protein NC111_02945 [Bacteroides sp.]|nr:hypothetical protein [Bacteroides sp.]MCM1413214.1 hypothetical protein [Bacteroides sp.]MCM1471476.1 hypothetical protein [Bacteroides sp.]
MTRRQPVIIVCRLIPRRFVVNLFGTFWVHDNRNLSPQMINHERIHTAQMRELLFIPFYIIYFLEWLMRLIQHRNWFKAYKAISFEKEAYTHGDDLTYLAWRRHYAQWR